MTDIPPKKIDPIRATTPEAILLAKTLIRQARYGALAFLDPATGNPGVSRVAVAPDFTGAPVIFVSRLSAHTKALLANPNCSILLGEPGKGDPLAHPRISVWAAAEFLDRSNPATGRIADRFLRRNPKAKLYAGFADFSFVRLTPSNASLNGGFGQAFNLEKVEILSQDIEWQEGFGNENDLLARLNAKSNTTVMEVFAAQTGKAPEKLTVESVDSEGMDVVSAGVYHRIWYRSPASTQNELFDLLLKNPEKPEKV
jgi:putative heme iron utilization protein